MSLDVVTLALAKAFSKQYTDSAISGISGGIHYKGAVNYYSDLPNNAEVGDAYTVKYKGSSGTETDGQEYVWASYEGTNQWIAFGPDMSQFQPLLVSGTNIKTVNNESLLGSGNISIVANVAFEPLYSIDTIITNGTSTGDTLVSLHCDATVTIAPDTDYQLPTTISVVGCDYTYDNITGVIALSQATDDVTITATCVPSSV